MLFSAPIGGAQEQLVGAENKNGVYYAFDRTNLGAGPVWSYTAENSALAQAAGSATDACEDVNTISSSAWAGPGSPVIVAGLAQSGSSCIGTLAALNPSTGQVAWQTPLQGEIEGAVTEVPGIVAVGAGPSVDLLSSATGMMLFSYRERRHPHAKASSTAHPLASSGHLRRLPARPFSLPIKMATCERSLHEQFLEKPDRPTGNGTALLRAHGERGARSTLHLPGRQIVPAPTRSEPWPVQTGGSPLIVTR